jgi:hypothetical protein
LWLDALLFVTTRTPCLVVVLSLPRPHAPRGTKFRAYAVQ